MKSLGSYVLHGIAVLVAIAALAWCLTMATLMVAPAAVDVVLGTMSGHLVDTSTDVSAEAKVSAEGVFFYLWGTLTVLLVVAPVAFAAAIRLLRGKS